MLFVRFFNLMSLSYLHVAGYLRLGGGGWQPPLRFRHGLAPRGMRDGRVGVRACSLESPADPGAQDLPRAAGMDGLQPPADPRREGTGIQHQPMARSVLGQQPRGPGDFVMGGDCSGLHPRGGAESELYQQPRGKSASLRPVMRVVIGGPKIESTWGCERPTPGDSCDCPKADVWGEQFREPRVGAPRSHRQNHSGGHSAEAGGPWPKGIGAASLPTDAEGSEVGVGIWMAGPSGWVQRSVKDLDEVQTAVQSIWGFGVADYWLVVEGRPWGGGRVLCWRGGCTSRSA